MHLPTTGLGGQGGGGGGAGQDKSPERSERGSFWKGSLDLDDSEPQKYICSTYKIAIEKASHRQSYVMEHPAVALSGKIAA